eukprot:347284-Chlamydomonas_euryale.AAC.1
MMRASAHVGAAPLMFSRQSTHLGMHDRCFHEKAGTQRAFHCNGRPKCCAPPKVLCAVCQTLEDIFP